MIKTAMVPADLPWLNLKSYARVVYAGAISLFKAALAIYVVDLCRYDVALFAYESGRWPATLIHNQNAIKCDVTV